MTGPAQSAPAAGNGRGDAGDQLTAAVLSAWAQAFESSEPGHDDDFFACGGHSLLAMRLVALLRASTGRDIGVDDIFRARTPSRLAADLAASDTDSRAGPAAAALSGAQRRIWFAEQLTPGTPAHNMASAVRLRGPLDIEALRGALDAVADRHEVLRWRIRGSDGVPAVTVQADPAVRLPVTRVAGETELAHLIEAEVGTAIDLEAGLPWRAQMFRLGQADHVLCLVVHHIVFDGWSQDVLYTDLGTAYERCAAGEAAFPGPPAARFADYVAEAEHRQAERGQQNLEWWQAQLADAPTVLDLPRDRPRPPVRRLAGACAELAAPAALTSRLGEFATASGVTRNAALLAAFGILIRRLTGRPDFVVAAPAADRSSARWDQVVGLFLQMLLVRIHVADEASFAEHAGWSLAELTGAWAHRDAPAERLAETHQRTRDLSRNPLYQVLFNAHDVAETVLRLPGLDCEPLAVPCPGALFDLTLHVTEREGQLIFRAIYDPELYDGKRIGRLLESYLQLVTGLLDQPGRPVSQASLQPPDSGQPGWHDSLPSWHGPGLIEQVGRAAAAQPDEPAVAGEELTLRYRDVAAIAAQTAAEVTDAGAGPGGAVAVIAGWHPGVPAVLLGVLRSGARWAVLDPAHPPEFLRRQLAALEPGAIIAFGWPAGLQPPGSIPAIDAGPLIRRALAAARKAAPPEPMAGHGSRGYVSLTSGTTGDPRIVLTGEAPLAHFISWYRSTFGLGRTDRFAMLSGLGHDPLLRDLFTPLALGAQLFVPCPEYRRDPVMLAGWLSTCGITVAHLTPQLARLLVTGAAESSLPSLRLVALAGDQVTHDDVLRLTRVARHARVVNFYGTTETPQAQAYRVLAEPRAGRPRHRALLPGSHPVPVGSGIDGAQVLVLDRAGQPAAVGELGEVVIRSRHLATGYADAELTRERFVPVPGGRADDRFFRTGDLGRFLPDGAVVLAGRDDGQVKIRGFRVETDEVRAVLEQHPHVGQAYVAVRQSGEEPVLAAYVVPVAGPLSAEEIRAFAGSRLPAYALPAEVMTVPALPLTPNGKVDVAALPRVSPRAAPAASRVLSGRTQLAIAAAWREALGRPRVGPDDSFFDIGGDSLSIVAVQAKLARLLDVHVPVADLFRYPTIASLASHLDGDRPGSPLDRAHRRAAARRKQLFRRSRR